MPNKSLGKTNTGVVQIAKFEEFWSTAVIVQKVIATHLFGKGISSRPKPLEIENEERKENSFDRQHH